MFKKLLFILRIILWPPHDNKKYRHPNNTPHIYLLLLTAVFIQKIGLSVTATVNCIIVSLSYNKTYGQHKSGNMYL